MSTETTHLREAGLPVTDFGPVLAEERDPLLFATVSGAHLYGFPSEDPDVDLRRDAGPGRGRDGPGHP